MWDVVLFLARHVDSPLVDAVRNFLEASSSHRLVHDFPESLIF